MAQSNQPSNPFIRGYNGLSVQRLLAISYADGAQLAYLPLHASQADLPDTAVAQASCDFNADFALVTRDQLVPPELKAQCPSHGIVRAVLYGVMAEEDGMPLRVGDTYSEAAAREVVRRLRFEPGAYSRCWEISNAHLTQAAWGFLTELADFAMPTTSLFVVFRVALTSAIGIQLIAKPWPEDRSQPQDGDAIDTPKPANPLAGVPESLSEVLRLAALADVRMLIFDAMAPVLDGLPVYTG